MTNERDKKLSHACKQTCSGYKAGYDEGRKEILESDELKAMVFCVYEGLRGCKQLQASGLQNQLAIDMLETTIANFEKMKEELK